ncbi:CLN3 protein [Dictyocaulus viviparus]|uniref:CLN3 protein n=1 Tax=Dictyocaulus viviparus TaxID=29172 RepID=A0A0D8XE40_DICVI|nr:CLN3 protein [Dictyocaulus viviparus]
MIPLSLIYMSEYLINQGVTQLIIFNCSEGFHLNVNAQYRWYQVLYQFGVLLSRSSVSWFELSTWMLLLLPVLQVSPDVREFTLSVASLGDSLGINIAGFVAIPLHNVVCHLSMPKTR